MKHQIRHRRTDAVLFECDVPEGVQASGTATRYTLEKAVEYGANLTGADLRDAYLRGADLRGADLTGAQVVSLSGCDLRGARLDGVDPSDCDFRDAVVTAGQAERYGLASRGVVVVR